MGQCEEELMHVLAVDDSSVDRKVIERLLQISCCKVTAVESGSKALELLGLEVENDDERRGLDVQDLKVNLIMTDYSMPGMTGYDLLKKIKGSSTYKEIPVVLMSSENIMTRIDRCLEEGAEDFLMKPVKLSDVERLRDSVMKGEDKPEPLLPESTPLVLTSTPLLSSEPTPSSTSQQPAMLGCPATPLKPTLTPLLASSDISCSLKHLSSPPSSPLWPSKRRRLLNGDT